MLEAVGLGDRIHYRPGGLSGGQKQRVAVTRGLVHEPQILLADEPTAALDEEAGRKVVTLFEKQAKERGTAIVIVTHDNRILDVADRIVKMDFGRIARDTKVRETSFIGEMLVRCSVFRGVTVRTLTRLAERMKQQSHPAGTRIIRQGNPGHRFYLIREGTADVTRDPGNVHLATLGPGDFFGETALLTGEPRNANVDAKTDITVYTLDAESFREAMAERDYHGPGGTQLFVRRLMCLYRDVQIIASDSFAHSRVRLVEMQSCRPPSSQTQIATFTCNDERMNEPWSGQCSRCWRQQLYWLARLQPRGSRHHHTFTTG